MKKSNRIKSNGAITKMMLASKKMRVKLDKLAYNESIQAYNEYKSDAKAPQ